MCPCVGAGVTCDALVFTARVLRWSYSVRRPPVGAPGVWGQGGACEHCTRQRTSCPRADLRVSLSFVCVRVCVSARIVRVVSAHVVVCRCRKAVQEGRACCAASASFHVHVRYKAVNSNALANLHRACNKCESSSPRVVQRFKRET
jgi:hypothetical protein